MFVDTARQEDSDHDIRAADICIVGGGAAGIALACELAGSSHQVLLIENGGLDAGSTRRGAYRLTAGKRVTLDLDPSMPSYLGGSTNYWFGNNRPLDDADFSRRPWIPHSGWPIARDDLDPYYERAQSLAGLGSSIWYDAEACRPYLPSPPISTDHALLETRIDHTSPVLSFAELHRKSLDEAPNVRILLGIRAVRFKTERPGSRVAAVETMGRDGTSQLIEADAFVLACGGVENARLLLLSNEADDGGLGNGNDLVGRYFMDHPYFDLGLPDWDNREFKFYEVQGRGEYVRAQQVGDAVVWGQLVLSEAAMAERGAPGLALWFAPSSRGTPSVVGMKSLARYALRRPGSVRPLSDAQLALTDPVAIPKYLLRRVFHGERSHTDRFRLQVEIEQTPNPDNRVTLSDARDEHGQPLAFLNFNLTADERSAHAESLRMAADAIGLDGRRLARQLELMMDAGHFGFFWHHMGTTRMSDDPLGGVVDRDCRVHGVPNLFVAGCSVFPTGGTAPPTLTIIALAVRLADHLKTRGTDRK